jgi:hypothetical protein
MSRLNLRNNRLKFKTGRNITNHFRGMYRMNPNSIKKNRRMSTCNRWDFANTRISAKLSLDLLCSFTSWMFVIVWFNVVETWGMIKLLLTATTHPLQFHEVGNPETDNQIVWSCALLTVQDWGKRHRSTGAGVLQVISMIYLSIPAGQLINLGARNVNHEKLHTCINPP